MTIKLSKPESKYRSKLFAERRYNKDEQKSIDEYITENPPCTYKQLYRTHSIGMPYGLFSGLAFRKLSKRFASLGVAMKDAQGEFKKTVDLLTEVSDKWEDVSEKERDRIVDTLNKC